MGIQAQLQGSGGDTIIDGENVLFDTVINDQSANISYSAATGEFTIMSAGNYYIDWWVSTDGASASTFVTFNLVLNGGVAISGSSPAVTGQLHGSAFITANVVPSAVTLVNASGDTVGYGAIPVQANIVIVEIDA